MANPDVCNNLLPLSFAKESVGTVELIASAEAASNHPTHTHPEVDRSDSLENALKNNTIGNAESRRGSGSLSKNVVVFCFAAGAAVVMIVVGFPLVLLGIYGTNFAADLAPGVENGVNGARSSMFVSGGALPVRVERRDGSDSQSSSGSLMGALTLVLAIVLALTCFAIVVLISC